MIIWGNNIKKIIIFFIGILSGFMLASCDSGVSIEHNMDEIGRSNPIYSEEYLGTWYGYGTDGTEAQFLMEISPIDDETVEIKIEGYGSNYRLTPSTSQVRFISETQAETLSQYYKIVYTLGKDSNGELAILEEFLDPETNIPSAQSAPFYRQPSRTDPWDFIPNAESLYATTPTAPPNSTTSGDAKRQQFTDRAKEIERYADEERNSAMTQAEINIASKRIYDRWDALLNEIYQYLKSTMPSAEFSVLEQDEEHWIMEKEAAAERDSAEYEGASMHAMIFNGTLITYTDYMLK